MAPMEVPQPSDNALQGLVQLLSAITTPKLPSASPAPATLAGRAESNGILDSLSEAFHRALEQDRHETEQDILAHIGFLSDIADALSQKLSHNPLKRDRLRHDLSQIQLRFPSFPTQPASKKPPNLTKEQISEPSQAPQVKKAPCTTASPPNRSDSSPSESNVSYHRVFIKNIPTNASAMTPAMAPAKAFEPEHTPSRKRKLSTRIDIAFVGQNGQTQSLDERIARCVERFTHNVRTETRGIFTQATFNEFITLWSSIKSSGNHVHFGYILSMDIPRMLPKFEEPYLELLRLRSIESESLSPLREYSLRIQLLKLRKSTECLTESLHKDGRLASTFLDIIPYPQGTKTIDFGMICQYFLKIDQAREKVPLPENQISMSMAQLIQLMEMAQGYYILTRKFGMGIMALIPSTWSWTHVLPWHDVTKAVAKAVHVDCPAARTLCVLIEDKYMRPFKDGRHMGCRAPSADEELLRSLRATLSQVARAKNVAIAAKGLMKSQESTPASSMSDPQDQAEKKKRSENTGSPNLAASAFLDANKHLLASTRILTTQDDPTVRADKLASPNKQEHAATTITTQQSSKATATKPSDPNINGNVPLKPTRQHHNPVTQPHEPASGRKNASQATVEPRSKDFSFKMPSQMQPSYANPLVSAQDIRPTRFMGREAKTPSPRKRVPRINHNESASPSERSRDRRRADL